MKNKIKNKRATMEMSVGTIVTIVLLMSVLVLGIVLIKNIFGGGMKVVDMTNEQLESEINKLFGEDQKLVIYPNSRKVTIKQDESDGFGIGIKNLLKGTSGTKTFSYDIVVADVGNCEIDKSEIENWIIVGKSESNIPIPVNDDSVQKVILEIPKGSPLCTFKLRVNVNAEGTSYDTDTVIIVVK